jgi:hypothetical protein
MDGNGGLKYSILKIHVETLWHLCIVIIGPDLALSIQGVYNVFFFDMEAI